MAVISFGYQHLESQSVHQKILVIYCGFVVLSVTDDEYHLKAIHPTIHFLKTSDQISSHSVGSSDSSSSS